MQTYYIVSDIHSYYKEFREELFKSGFRVGNKEDVLILCGDAFDRGDNPVKLYKFLKKLNKQKRLIYIRGNHEDLLFDCAKGFKNDEMISRHHFSNGTTDTVTIFWSFGLLDEVLDFIEKNTVDYYKLDKYIFVHGWVPCIDYEKASKEQWKEARWLNGMEQWHKGDYIENKVIVCGHFHCSWGWHNIDNKCPEFPNKKTKHWKESFKPYIKENIVALDACTAYSGLVNILKITL